MDIARKPGGIIIHERSGGRSIRRVWSVENYVIFLVNVARKPRDAFAHRAQTGTDSCAILFLVDAVQKSGGKSVRRARGIGSIGHFGFTVPFNFGDHVVLLSA